ncbi:Hypothetical_protein [Hexamita inflata]|uniref:Hypothetical_protein n=1 Tax=Hexamita inflata TaxID=28002 RepID=A0AA86V6M7_9EUKA|nr:Hypothetical protein HINF_LOCUS65957 [Hexamita inflata]
MACSSNCNNVVLKSEQILLEQWQLIQGCDINNHYMQYYIYSVSRVHRAYPSRPPFASSERTDQLWCSDICQLHQTSSFPRAFCHGRIALRSSDSGPRRRPTALRCGKLQARPGTPLWRLGEKQEPREKENVRHNRFPRSLPARYLRLPDQTSLRNLEQDAVLNWQYDRTNSYSIQVVSSKWWPRRSSLPA